ncbi:DUF5057 domain-containing protein [Blautia wexlerae]|nr:DUF5057 domain-containing protein [Blautia wexlerae]RHQ38485.1 DUF5057 domain-containing protein [Ruminococcus sp. AF25-28AC]MCB5688303.1 DUF5057 domain-containing protein [Blautia wexlerae]NSD01605.1 DUF5057 domain-containing protein [Blautia wexlerae]NSE92915.1 DUF5057 domain-containing protein [Blautia wexlerae]NSF14514.1 DUF5057 domain-containing protein [Blautia wexlerae]
MMKIRHKKIVASGTAVALAGILGVGALFQSSISVQASPAMMPGIEQIVNDTTAEKPFKILEIVDRKDEAEIGYYVSGQEPYVKLYQYQYTDDKNQAHTITFDSLDEGLSKISDPVKRKEFAMNVNLNQDGSIDTSNSTGIKQIKNVCYQTGSSTGQSSDYPLSYSDYQEKYFLTQEEKNSNSWKEIKQFLDPVTDKPITYTVKINGTYQENPAGTGDYTKKEQQYYPIREKANDTDTGDADNPNAKYRENIQNFYYADSDGANAPYFLEFSEVENTTVNNALKDSSDQGKKTILPEYNYDNGKYGYYENVYSDLTTEIANNIFNKNYTFPGENPASPDGNKLLIQNNTSAENAFSSGGEEFTSLDEGNGTEQSNTEDNITGQNQQDVVMSEPQIDSGAADAGFSDGEFSSEELNAGESDVSSTDSNGQDNNVSSAPEEEIVTDNEATKQGDTDKTGQNKERLIEYTPLIENGIAVAVSTPGDPLVYYGITIDQYPFYQYKLISNLNTIKTKAINVDAITDPNFKLEEKLEETKIETTEKTQYCNITIQDGQYWFWLWNKGESVNNAVKYPISIVTQRQPVAYSDIRQLPEDLGYNYYYKVDKVYFCCKKDETAAAGDSHAYKYYGWYSPSYADENNPYILAENGKTATHYISDAEYKLTPGTGNYDFVPDDTAPEQTVEVDHMYYQGGYTNHDWFKQYVFHLEPGDEGSDERKQFDAFKIEVTTITAKEFNEKYGSAEETASGDSEATETTGDGDSTDPDHSSADDSANSDDVQADNSQTEDNQLDDVQTDNTSDEQNTDTQNANETQAEDQAVAQNEVDTSEVDPMVSEAGVELVSIEKEFSDSTDNEENQEESFQDGTENEVMPEAESSSDESFSAGDTASDSGKTKLEDYDLIYLNGTRLNESSYQKILDIVSPQKSKKKPCIINQTKLQNNETFKSSFASIMNDSDTDGHYVNCNVYFFKNSFLSDDQDSGSLLNVLFDKNFNPAYTEESDSFSDGNNSLMEGFEEILKYIEKENKYRKIKENSTNKDNTENQENQEEKKVTLLSTKISQARAIEYIINYRLKRNDLPTGKIRVLELQPARSQGEITSSQVLGWLGHEMTVISCCNHTGEPAANVLNDEESIWHSAYTSSDNNYNHKGKHYLEISFTNPEDVDGFIYRARPTGKNGAIYKYILELYDENNNKIAQIPGNFDRKEIDRESATIKFEKTYSNVKSMKLIFESTFADNINYIDKFASARKFLPIFHNKQANVEITTMTTSEFVGHIDDLNTKYDMIYLGDDDKDLVYDGNFRPGDKVLYYHVGGNKLARYELQGLMNHDYVTNGSQKKAAKVGDKDSATGTTIGSVRGSGNDITKEIKNKLVNFAKSGYPVVVAGNIYGENKKTISTTLVDNSSYIYDFLNEVKGFDNVYKEGEITADEDINFYAELPKPKIELSSYPPSAIGTGDGPSNEFLTGENMTFQFQIIDEAQASPANAEYNCELYIDLNCDGNFSKSEKLDDIAVMQNGNVIKKENGIYQLSLNTTYTVSRKIPQEYIKLMPWKLVVTNNNNSEIRTSEIGYTKRQNTTSTKNTINVLQIIPNNSAECTWNLATDTTFQNLFDKVKDFNVKISTITVGQYETHYSANATYLNQYNMLIIGFCDGAGYGSNYGGNNPTNFSENGALRILEFANTGKSVILAHDNTSSSVYDRTAQNGGISGDSTWKGWAYFFNQTLRRASGMDRYGITAPQSTSDILKQAKELDTNAQSTDWNAISKNSSDMAYYLNKNKEKTYSETQGFTNGKLRIANTTRETGSTEVTTTASQVNEGAITEYPYKIDKKITVAPTHFQYYQLALEENADEDDSGDLVVWYCLGDKDNKTGNGYYAHSPNDVRNNYYIYSYKNIIYTGVGHKPVTNNGNLMEKKLFVNTIIAAYNAQAVNPELMFVKQSDRNAAQEKTVYYTLDNVNFNESQELIKNKPLEFHLKVTDSNLVGTSFAGTNTKDLKLQLYIESDNGTKFEGIGGENTKVVPIDVPVYEAGNKDSLEKDSNGCIYVNSGKVYDFTLNDLPDYENYLKTSAGYKGKVTLYAKISCKYIYYGTEKEAQSVAQINICQRQLFDLD